MERERERHGSIEIDIKTHTQTQTQTPLWRIDRISLGHFFLSFLFPISYFSATMPLIKRSGSNRNGNGSNSKNVPPLKKSRSANRVRSRSIFLFNQSHHQSNFFFPLSCTNEKKNLLSSGWDETNGWLFTVAALAGHGFHQRYKSVEKLLLPIQNGSTTTPLFTTFGQSLDIESSSAIIRLIIECVCVVTWRNFFMTTKYISRTRASCLTFGSGSSHSIIRYLPVFKQMDINTIGQMRQISSEYRHERSACRTNKSNWLRQSWHRLVEWGKWANQLNTRPSPIG